MVRDTGKATERFLRSAAAGDVEAMTTLHDAATHAAEVSQQSDTR
jgi:hypothetical protein